MEESKELRLFATFSWRWLVTAYCSLVLFHLAPSYFLFGFRPLLRYQTPDFLVVWLGVGILIVSIYGAYRSRGWTVFEPALASLLYGATVFFIFPAVSPRPGVVRTRLMILALSFAFGFGGAILGELLQALKDKRTAKSVTQA